MSACKYFWMWDGDKGWDYSSTGATLKDVINAGYTIVAIEDHLTWVFCEKAKSKDWPKVRVRFDLSKDAEELLFQEMVAARFRETGEQPKPRKVP